MFQIIKNPINTIVSNFDHLATLLANDHIKKNQNLIISLGIQVNKDEGKYDYTMNFSFLNYVGYAPDAKSKTFTLPIKIVETDGFTIENAQVASRIYLKYLNKDHKTIEQYVKYVWNEYNIGLKVITKLPEELKSYLDPSDFKKLLNKIENTIDE